MLLTSADLEHIHRYTNHHRPLVEQSTEAGCIHCGAHFGTDEIREWIAERNPDTGRISAETAKCPRCGVDSVLPSAAPVTLDAHSLAALQAFWFSGKR